METSEDNDLLGEAMQKFAASAAGTYPPTFGLNAMYARAFHASKIKAIERYCTDFVALEGWPPEGKHLLKSALFKRGQFIANFPTFTCGAQPPVVAHLVTRALMKEYEAPLTERQSAQEQLRAISLVHAYCVRRILHERCLEKRRDRFEGNVHVLLAWIGDALVFIFIATVALTIIAILYKYAMPLLIRTVAAFVALNGDAYV